MSLPIYLDETLSFETRAADLVSHMTLFEKASQLTYNSAAIERLGIPSYNWWNEALHGVARAGLATVFPQAIGMASTFDEDLLTSVGDVISTEGRAKYHESVRKGDRDIYKGLTFWSPNVNIFRDPRWGRGHETYGEDPYLSTRLGVAFINGLQGSDPKYMKSAACAKHFAVHSGPEALRHSFNAEVSQKDLRETYLPAFKAAVKEAKVEAVMGAYNRTNGEPCCGSETLLTGILRNEWGFLGHVTSDCWAIKDFHEGHNVTATAIDSVALAINNGCDLNCGNMYLNLMLAYQEGLVTEETITQSVTRLMTARMKLGMFDKPEHVPYAQIPYERNNCKEHRDFALEVSRQSLVLLKNEDHLLPVDKNKIKTIAVIGPNANSEAALIGNYFGTDSRYITVLDGIQGAVNEDTRVFYSEGCHLFKDKTENLAEPRDRFSEAISIAEKSDVVVMCLGLDASIEGEEGDASNAYASGDKLDLNLPGLQQELLEAVQATRTPVILVLMSGSALAVNWAQMHVPAIVQAWYPGARGGTAVAELLFGDFCPSGKLPVTFYKTTEELPAFEDYAMKNRTYRYMKNEALYPFGYGLSYTNFCYSSLMLSKSTISSGETLTIQVEVENTGNREGIATSQLYLKDIEASVEVPCWSLTGIRRNMLKPGQKETLTFTLTPRDLAIIDNSGSAVLEPGWFEVFVGDHQPDDRSNRLMSSVVLSERFEVLGDCVKLEY